MSEYFTFNQLNILINMKKWVNTFKKCKRNIIFIEKNKNTKEHVSFFAKKKRQ